MPSSPLLPDDPATGGRLTVDLGSLAANWRTLAGLAGGAETAAVVKADAYGIGIERAVPALEAAGCRTFFVAIAAEGLRVRAVAPDAVIYVLAGLLPGSETLLKAGGLRPVLNTAESVERWAGFGRGTAPAALHVDTGMNRLGLTEAEAEALAAQPELRRAAGLSLVMSHLACADRPDHPKNALQLDAFRRVRALFPALPASLANSAGILLSPDYHFDLVRPGIALYGAEAAEGARPLAAVATAEARVLQIRDAAAGEAVGYGAAETLRRPSRLAILAAGYADGYHRAAGSSDDGTGAPVFVGGGFAPLVGRVSMDLMAADITELPDVRPGDWAELFGPHVPVDTVATRAGTIGYELLTGLGRRYARHYR